MTYISSDDVKRENIHFQRIHKVSFEIDREMYRLRNFEMFLEYSLKSVLWSLLLQKFNTGSIKLASDKLLSSVVSAFNISN